MRVASIIDISLVDVPGLPVTVIFTGGCNFDCPYCQNASLIPLDSGDEISPPELVSRVNGFLSDGFCITGGEPTLHKDLPDYLKALREQIGGHINLNTQGSNPTVLKNCLPYLNSVWFDLKASPKRYRDVCRLGTDPWPRIEKSIELVVKSDVAFWPRTTLVENLMTLDDIRDIISFLRSIRFVGRYRIQDYVASSGVRETERSHFAKFHLAEVQLFVDTVNAGFDIHLEWR